MKFGGKVYAPRWLLRCMACFCGSYRVFIELPPLARRPTLPDARMWATAEALLSLQSYVSNWYPQINMSAKQQNREPAKQYVSKTTKQCVNTTAKQQNRDFSQSVLQSVSTSVSQCFSQSVLTSISQSAFLKKTLCGPSFFDRFCSRCRLRERAVRLFRLAGEQAGTGRDIRPVFESPEHYMFGTQQAVFSVTRNILGNENSLPARGWKTPPKSSLFTGATVS